MDLSSFTNKVSSAYNKGMSDFIPATEAIHTIAKSKVAENVQSKKVEEIER